MSATLLPIIISDVEEGGGFGMDEEQSTMKYVKSILKPRPGSDRNPNTSIRERSSSDDSGATEEEPSNPSDSARSLVADASRVGVPGSAPETEPGPADSLFLEGSSGGAMRPVKGARRRILFGNVTTHVFDKKRPPCSTSATGRQSRLKHPGGVGVGAPSRWGGCSEGGTSSSTGRRGSLMPFLPRRRSSDDAPSSSKAEDCRRTMREAAALIEDPSCELGRESRQHGSSRAQHTPLPVTKRGGSVCR